MDNDNNHDREERREGGGRGRGEGKGRCIVKASLESGKIHRERVRENDSMSRTWPFRSGEGKTSFSSLGGVKDGVVA